jgi:hypothetical protein
MAGGPAVADRVLSQVGGGGVAAAALRIDRARTFCAATIEPCVVAASSAIVRARGAVASVWTTVQRLLDRRRA